MQGSCKKCQFVTIASVNCRLKHSFHRWAIWHTYIHTPFTQGNNVHSWKESGLICSYVNIRQELVGEEWDMWCEKQYSMFWLPKCLIQINFTWSQTIFLIGLYTTWLAALFESNNYGLRSTSPHLTVISANVWLVVQLQSLVLSILSNLWTLYSQPSSQVMDWQHVGTQLWKLFY